MNHRSFVPQVLRGMRRAPGRVALVAAIVLGGGLSAHALLSSTELGIVKAVEPPAFEPRRKLLDRCARVRCLDLDPLADEHLQPPRRSSDKAHSSS